MKIESTRPRSVTAALVLLWLGLGDALVAGLVAINQGHFADEYAPGLLYGILGSKVALNALIVVKISQGRYWARLMLLTLLVVGILPGLYVVASEYRQSALLTALSALRIGLLICGVHLVWRASANKWFHRVPETLAPRASVKHGQRTLV